MANKQHRAGSKRSRPGLITVDLGKERLQRLNRLVGWYNYTYPGDKRFTVSSVLREALDDLLDDWKPLLDKERETTDAAK